MRSTIAIVTSCDSFVVILITSKLQSSSSKLENGLKKHIHNDPGIKYGSAKLVAIFTFYKRCGYVIPYY